MNKTVLVLAVTGALITWSTHSIAAKPEWAGKGKPDLEEVKTLAEFRGCVKLTLEVLENNDRAKKAYENFGFAPYELGDVGQAEFWEMYLNKDKA